MESPVLFCATNVHFAVPELREENSATRIDEAAGRTVDGRAIVAAQGSVDGARRRAAERLICGYRRCRIVVGRATATARM